MEYSQSQTNLSKGQYEAVGLLSIGTILEYFDLMLYVHMAVLLNDLFFPKTDPHTAALLTAFAFCSSYIMRPFSALLFGWIGDNIGRKYTVVITTTLMGGSCLVMFFLPTYQDIGITAAWLMILCRMIQGMTSMGEVIGASLYITEMTNPPSQYVAVGMIEICSTLGNVIALIWAMICTSYLLNWRYAFLGGAFVAVLGSIARTKLREAPEFADAKKRVANIMREFNLDSEKLLKKSYPMLTEFPHWKTSLAYFLIFAGGPSFFYFTFIHCAGILKKNFSYTGAQIIINNLFVTLWSLLVVIFLVFLSKKINPLKTVKVIAIFVLVAIFFCLYFLSNAKTGFEVFLIQLVLVIGLYPRAAIPIL